MPGSYWWRRGGTVHGPVSPSELRRLASAGKILPTDEVRSSTAGEWVIAKAARGLFPDPAASEESNETKLALRSAATPSTQPRERWPRVLLTGSLLLNFAAAVVIVILLPNPPPVPVNPSRAPERTPGVPGDSPARASERVSVNTELKSTIVRSEPPKTAPPPESPRGAIDVTTRQIEIVGDRFINKTVRFYDARFYKADNSKVTRLPGIQIDTNGLITLFDGNAYERWVGFYAEDAEGDAFWNFFCDKATNVDLILSLKRNDHLVIEGVVIELATGRERAVVVTHLEKLK